MEKIHKKTLVLALCIFVLFFACFWVNEAQGASVSLYLSPPSGTYAIGSTFSVMVKVNSGGEAINAAEGTLIFNPDRLQIVNLSKSGSIFTLWTAEPTFSNSIGNITFGGGRPSKFSGSSGTIITITFKAIANASARITFSSGSVLAADGKGTNVLAYMVSGTYVIKTKVVTESPEGYIPSLVPAGAPAASIVSSSTHPDSEKWYSNNNPEFSWELPQDVTGASLALHPEPFADPGPISDGLMESKKFEDVEGGIWYFHIKLKNKYGWGEITHRKVLIALEAPVITDFPQTVRVGDILVIKGASKYPDATVTVFVKKEGEESRLKHVKTDKEGNWLFIYDKSLEEGTYQVWIEITDNQGAKSRPTEKITIAAALPAFLKFGKIAIDYLAIIITLIALIVVLIAVILYAWHRICLWREKIRRETREAKRSVARAFKLLQEELLEQIEYFDKKPGLSKREKEIRKKLNKALKISEEFISKEIKDVLKEL